MVVYNAVAYFKSLKDIFIWCVCISSVTGLLLVPFAFKLSTDAVNTDAVLIIYLLFVGIIPIPFSAAEKKNRLFSCIYSAG